MSSGIYYKGLQCWIPDKERQWSPGIVKSCAIESNKATLIVEDEDGNETTLPAKPEDLEEEGKNGLPFLRSSLSDPDDLTNLAYLNEPSVLDALLTRYNQLQIYTYSGIVLIALNPFQSLPKLYTPEVVRVYSEKSRDQLDPHLYAIAEDSFKCMNREKKNQTIIISGESGAGKTVSARYIMRYFASVQTLSDPSSSGNSNSDPVQLTAVENEILATNPIMEAFGNSKTSRNDNSSRFGKYIQIMFDKNSIIIGAKIQTYLLERSRLVFQPKSERNYHIFYQLLAGASPEQLEEWHLSSNVDDYHYLRQGESHTINGVDDAKEFRETVNALKTVSINDDTSKSIFNLLAALLHVGNIEIKGSRNDSYIDSKNEHLLNASMLLGVDSSSLTKWLTKRKIKMASEGIIKPLTDYQGLVVRDSVSKFLYASLFDWLVATINTALMDSAVKQKQISESFIGVLDIYGFEHFEKNSFEQFCINYANEKLQQEFYKHVFKLEQDEYANEGLNWSYIDYQDNQQCISMIENRMGILSLLDEECRMPTNSDENWVTKLNDAFDKPEFKNSYKKARFGNNSFTVRHYALDVTYNAEGFIEKNKDTISDELIDLFSESSVPFIKDLVQFRLQQTASQESGAPSNKRSKTKPKSNTLGSMFKNSLISLMGTINETNAHYIRCIKPNEQKEAWKFNNVMVTSQLRACGVLETIKISCAGFPSRWTFEDFVSQYYMLVPSADRSDDPLAFSTAILGKTIDSTKYQIGKSKIFFRSGVTPQLEAAKDRALKHAAQLLYDVFATNYYRTRFLNLRKRVSRFQAMAHGFLSRRTTQAEVISKSVSIISSLWKTYIERKKFLEAKASIVLLQSVVRGFLFRRNQRAGKMEQAAATIKNVWKTHLERQSFRKLRHCTIRIQSLIRMKYAMGQLVELRIESKKASHFKQVSYKLESKLFDMTKKLDKSEQENTKLKDRIFELESHLSNYAEATLSKERELEQTHVLLSDHSQDQEYKSVLSGKEKELSDLRNSIEQYKDDNQELLRMNTTLKGQLGKDAEVISSQTAEIKDKNRIIAKLTKASKVLNSSFGSEQTRASEEKSRRDSSLTEMRTQKELLILLMNDGLKHDLDKLTEFAGRTYVWEKTVKLLNRSEEDESKPHLFLAKALFIIISQMWKTNLSEESIALIERYCVHILEYISQRTQIRREVRADMGFWIANTHTLLYLVRTKLYGLKRSSSLTLSFSESYDAIHTVFDMLGSHLSRIVSTWIDQITAALRPLIVDGIIISGNQIDKGEKRLIPRVFDKDVKSIEHILHILNEVHDSCQTYRVSLAIFACVISSLYRFIDVEAFNALMTKEKGSWKRGVNMSYNFSRLREWCTQRGVVEATLQLEEISQASKFLQTCMNKQKILDNVSLLWILNMQQLRKLLDKYVAETYESKVPKKVMDELSNMARAEGLDRPETITYDKVMYELNDTFEEEPSLEQVTIPVECKVTYIQRIIDLASAEESFDQAVLTLHDNSVESNPFENQENELRDIGNGVKTE
ncbi:myosin type V [Schizosaccharomyces osmophilus]|uniref:Myosin type V n=1 Tax=Schizosaccharomyces osmophilus TaxID=2545709 RepID=A0AAE9WFW7_9SCHI|nr:myosin type V [Schizosaccharomyces osmophilus]WBW75450.1 myosin type V [Schizosaccharomyces osmophilus]